MKRKSYNIQEEEKILIYEEDYDSNGKVVYSKDYQSEPILEKYTTFDSNGYINSEVEIAEGIETSKYTVLYDETGEAIEQNQFISGELYEKVLTIKDANGYERKTIQDGNEVESMFRLNSSETRDYENKFYVNDELVEKQTYEFNNCENIGTTKTYDADENIVGIQIEYLDEEDRIKIYRDFNENGNLIEEIIAEYKDDLVITEIHRQFLDSPFEHFISYLYDENKNQIKKEVKTSTDNLVEFYNSNYDSNNRLISENGYSVGNFDAIYGTYFNNNKFNILHEYKE